jgi:two-component system phosphate regulon sensor histidine kinase PhoR
VKNSWRAELARIGGLLLLALVPAWIGGHYLVWLLVALAGYLFWHLYNLYRLIRWLRAGKGYQPPESSGLWDEVFESIHRLIQRNRRRKKNLRRLLKRFHAMAAALPDAMVELRSGSDEIEWWNDSAAELLGFSYPRDAGQRLGNLLRHPEFQRLLQMQEFDDEILVPSPVDDSMTLQVRIIRYSKNQRMLLARDITRLLQLERTRKDFVANASHELRSPLTVLSGYLETLVNASGSCGEYQPQLKIMVSQSERMERIIEDLLLLSRLESEEPRTDPYPVNVPKLLNSLIQQARELSGEKDHRFETDIDAGLCLRGRESELYSAFSNLLFNAVRYTPPGGHIATSWKDTDEGPRFSVRDSGVGIATHHLPRLTERFYRVDTGRSRATGGTGLGLAIVKHVLKRHQAHLQIDSEEGAGSEFSCHFDKNRRIGCDQR